MIPNRASNSGPNASTAKCPNCNNEIGVVKWERDECGMSPILKPHRCLVNGNELKRQTAYTLSQYNRDSK
jgi:hypothetical protein